MGIQRISEEKGLFPQVFSDLLNSPLRLQPPPKTVLVLFFAIFSWPSFFGGRKKPNKQKTHKRFSDHPCVTIPRDKPHPSQGQMGQNGDFTVELNRERPVCPRDGSQFVPGRGPVCPRDGSCLSRTPSRPKCLCLSELAGSGPIPKSQFSKFPGSGLKKI